MASRPTVRVKVSPKFPAQVIAGDGITIEQSGGAYTFSTTGGVAGPGAATGRAVAVFDGETGQLLDDTTATIGEGGTLAINPTAGSTNRGVVITQSSPTTGTTQGEFRFNQIDVTSAVRVLPTVPSTQLPFADNVSAGLKITMDEGTNAGGFQIPLLVRLNHTTPTDIWGGGSGPADHIVFAVQGQSSAADTSLPGGAGYYAISAALYFSAGAEHTNIVALNPELSIDPAVVVEYTTALRLQKNDTGSGSISDAAITTFARLAGTGWKNFVNFSEQREAQSILPTGNIFNAQQAFTVANFANLSNMTVTGSVLKFPHVNLTGAGVLTLNPNTVAIGSVPVPGTGTVLQVVTADGVLGAVEVETFGSGVAEVPFFRGQRSRGTAASRSAVQANDALGSFVGAGYDGSAYGLAHGGMTVFAAENFTGSAHGTYLTFSTTPAGSTTIAPHGKVSDTGLWTLTQNSVAIGTIPAPPAGTVLQLVAADTTLAGIELETFGSSGIESPTFRGMRSRGTAASRAAVQADDALAVFGGGGFNSSTYTGVRSGITAFAAETWTSGANGSYLTFFTTPTGTTTGTTRGAVEADGGLTWPRNVSGGSKGAGTINANEVYQANQRVATLSNAEELFNKTLNASIAKGTWTASGTWTISAVTLGGAVSGGGNQINNVIIGASTPLAGSFTTLNASAFVAAPVHVGGGGASSTLTLESTSGSGTSDAIIFLTGSQVHAGRINTSQQWVIGQNTAPSTGVIMQISGNSTALPSADTGTLLHLGNANDATPRILLDAFGFVSAANPSAAVTYRRARGTAGSPSAVQSGDLLGSNFAKGRGNAGTYLDNAGAGFVMVATENYTTTGGARIDLYTTANGSSITSAKATLDGLGSFTINKTTALPAGGTQSTGLMFSTTADFGIFFGSGAPSLSAAKGSLYLRSDGSATNNRAYINTDGGTTWTALTTAA